MTNFLIIGICLIAGIFVRRLNILPLDAHKGINAWLLYLAMPAVSFKYLPHIQWSLHLLFPLLAPVLVWVGAYAYIRFYSARAKLSKSTAAGLTLTGGISNTSFLGFPMVAAFFSDKDIAIAVICDQIGFIILTTLGVALAIHSSSASQQVSPKVFVKKMLSFPAFWACGLALILPRFIDISALDPLFDRLAGTVAPLALFSIGLQLSFKGYKNQLKHISATLLYKLLIAPAVLTLIALAFQLRGVVTQVTIFEMAMPPLMSASIVAGEYKLNPGLANLVIGIGMLLCFATVTVWWLVMQILL
ncbi:AEC family transporter [Mucilaginibacter calamicampi]|uniref:AEC family transporter n=1 Tax=Mucilaginibacter calamicampi TaxID=1302352 RepID=A0ABW2YV18_9SPHI